MNPLIVVSDSLYFFRRHAWGIARLCLPWVVLEALAQQVTDHLGGGEQQHWVYSLMVTMVFYPLYTAAVLLYLNSRTEGQPMPHNAMLAMALRLWPRMALLTAISYLLILAGLSLFILPGLWVMVRLAFAEYLLVLEGCTPLEALGRSLRMSQGHWLPISGCLLLAMVPLWLLEALVDTLWPEQSPPVALLLDSVISFLQLFTSVVMFRLYWLIRPHHKATARP